MADRVPGGEDAGAQEAFEYDVFLSFASADHEAAEAIYRTLTQGGLRVFWAPNTLRAGQRFFQVIAKSLTRSQHFVLYWTDRASASPWVEEEYEAFFSQCYVKSRDTRKLIVLPDGRESISTLPSLLQTRQFARSAEDVLGQLGGQGRSTEPRVSALPLPSVHPGHPVVSAPGDPPVDTAIEGPLGMRMRFVPSGLYTIGSPENEPGRRENETRHEVQLTRGFWLGETPVTQNQWRQLVPGPKQPSTFKSGGDDLPVESVNWCEAAEFANRLSDREGLPRCYDLVNPRGTLGGGDFECDGATFAGLDCPGYRLPTEAEWEIVARAGTPTAIYTGALTLAGERNGPELHPIAWYGGNSGVSYEGGTDSSKWAEMQFPTARSGPHPVGKKRANAWGFHDLLGNVFEWTGDGFGDYPKGLGVDPLGPPGGSLRVFRGGSWYSIARDCRAADRSWIDPSVRWYDLGFRLARGQFLRSGPGGRSPGS